jgi:predicted aconitase
MSRIAPSPSISAPATSAANNARLLAQLSRMELNDLERAMLGGELGLAVQEAIGHQVKVGEFFGAKEFVPVTQAHVMADTESLGPSGVSWLESLARADGARARVRVPTITDPRGTDFAKAGLLKHADWMLDLERRAIDAFTRLGVSMTDTCINYQTIQAPTRGESVAFGDTGVVIYSNSVCGARSNFEGGPSALAAGLTGRTPRYGFHLDAQRRGTLRIRVDWTPEALNDWGALGGVIGRLAGHYWAVPVVEGLEAAPGSDALKHFGAAMASFGSIALFHLAGITPEATRLGDTGAEHLPLAHRVGEAEVRALQTHYAGTQDIDVVVFSAPQLSLYELRMLAALCDGRRFAKPLLAVTSPQVKPDADRFGFTARIEAAGGHVLSGMCFYQSYAREIAEANGWKRLATNSAKMVNILGGYGYAPVLASMERCVEAAETGRLS